jgi:hypothetical protein
LAQELYFDRAAGRMCRESVSLAEFADHTALDVPYTGPTTVALRAAV